MKFLLGLLFQNDTRGAARILESVKQFRDDHPSIAICLIDDASSDGTPAVIEKFLSDTPVPNVTFLRNTRSFGRGGNQKLLYRLAIEQGFGAVLFLRANPPAVLAAASALFARHDVAAETGLVIGIPDRTGLRGLLRSPLTVAQRALAGQTVKGWHSPFKLFSTRALKKTAFELNAGGAQFDTELLLELIDTGAPIVEFKDRAFRLPSGWGLGGFRAAVNSLKASLKHRLQRVNLFYDIRYHPDSAAMTHTTQRQEEHYSAKFDSLSPHSIVLNNESLVPPSATVLDLGCSSGYVARELMVRKSCRVTGVDVLPADEVDGKLTAYHKIDLDDGQRELSELMEKTHFDVILLLDVLEHLSDPEHFLLNLTRRSYAAPPVIVMSTGNVAFIAVRLMLLFGFFNYGRRGILDVTHKRLFSLRTFRNMAEQTGLLVLERHYFPFPFRALGFPKGIARILEVINIGLIKLAPSLFAYQIMFKTTPIALQYPKRVFE